MSTTRVKYLELARELAIRAGTRIRERRERSDFTVTLKSERNPVTDADIEAEAIILGDIKKHFPEDQILSEETLSDVNIEKLRQSTYWIVDPIDGTVNYSRGHRQCGVSIAIAEKGEVIVGVVYAPFDNELFHAIKGGGAFCNGKAISVRKTAGLHDALVATGFPYERTNVDELLRRVGAVLRNCQDVRRIGAASLDICWVACGRVDAFYEDVMPWDMAAGALIAREAGAELLRFRETSSELPESLRGDSVLLATPQVAGALRKLLLEASIND